MVEAHIGQGMKVRASRSGLHAFDRRSGLNILLDEVEPPRDSWARAPRYVSIALTNACDLECPYCYAPKHAARLDYDAVVAWAIELDEEGCLGLGFGGGEPLLYPRFAELCAEISALTRLAVSFTTHAHWITPVVADALHGSVHFIRVSVDGYGATYERLRGRSFESLGAHLGSVRRIAPFGVNYVVNAETIEDLAVTAAWAREAGAVELLLLPEVAVKGRPGADRATLARLDQWVAQNRHAYRLAVSEAATEFLTSPFLDTFISEEPLERYAHIDASGQLKASSFDGTGVVVGDAGGVTAALDRLRTINTEETA